MAGEQKSKEPGCISRSAMKGAIWTITGYGGMQVLRFGFNLALARLLLPEVFGLMAIVNVLNQGIQMLSDTGVWLCVLRSKRGDESAFLQTAWTFGIVRGCLLAVAAAMIAWPAAEFYHDSRLLPLIAVSGLASAILPLRSIVCFTQNRKLALGRLVVIEIASYTLSMTAATVWIWHSPTAWALVASIIVAAVLQVVLSHTILPRFAAGHRFRWDRTAVHELVSFGRWVFVSTVCTFLAGQADRLLIGHIDSVAALGVYHIAAMFATLPAFLVTCITNQVLVPYFSRLKEQGNEPRIRQVEFLVCVFAWWMTAGVQLLGPAVVSSLYSSAYEQAGMIIRILCIGSWFAILQCVSSCVILAEGRSQSAALMNFCKLVALAIAVPLLAPYGLSWLLWAFVIGDLARYLVGLVLLRQHGLLVPLQHLGLTVLLLLPPQVFAWTGYSGSLFVNAAWQGAVILACGGVVLLGWLVMVQRQRRIAAVALNQIL